MPTTITATEPGSRAAHNRNVVTRLRPGVSLPQAHAELEIVVARWQELNPGEHTPGPEGHPIPLVPLHDDVVGDVRPAMLLLLGAVGFALLIACANVANPAARAGGAAAARNRRTLGWARAAGG
jgi:putative ABC transport system permease protein